MQCKYLCLDSAVLSQERYKCVSFKLDECYSVRWEAQLEIFHILKENARKMVIKNMSAWGARHVHAGAISLAHVSKTLCLSLYAVGHKQFVFFPAKSCWLGHSYPTNRQITPSVSICCPNVDSKTLQIIQAIKFRLDIILKLMGWNNLGHSFARWIFGPRN